MRNFTIYLLMYPLTLFACQQDRLRNVVNHNILLDSTVTDTRVNHKETLLIDSAKVTIFCACSGCEYNKHFSI